MTHKPNILLLTRYFPPEIGSNANLFHELAKGLAANGNNVTVVTEFPWYNIENIPDRYRGRFFLREMIDGAEVIRLTLPLPGSRRFRLAAGHLTVPVTAFVGGLLARKPDIVFLYSPPLFLGLSGWLIGALRKIPFVMNVQDLHPQCYIDQGILKNRFIIRIFETLEKFCYGKSSLITVQSQGNKEHVVGRKGVEESKVRILSNWIDTDEMTPLSRENDFSRKYGLNEKFVVGYAGTLGMSQGLMSVVDAAIILKDRADIEFFIVGDGIEKQRMMDKTKEFGLSNIRFLGMQPKSVYPYIVASSDVSLVTLNSKVRTPTNPSKIQNIMAAGRPVLASVPLYGDTPKLIAEARCGICVEPESPAQLAEKIVYLSGRRDLCLELGRNGREFAVENLSLKKAVGVIEEMLAEVVSRRVKNMRT